jgi:hypothetical protein
MLPSPDLNMLAKGMGEASILVGAKLLRDCQLQAECVLKEPLRQYEAVIERVRSGAVVAETSSKGPMKVPLGALFGFMTDNLTGGSQWSKITDMLFRLGSDDDVIVESAAKELLDFACCIKLDPDPDVGACEPTWFEYGVCVSEASVGRSLAFFSIIAGDYPGRYLPSQVGRKVAARTLEEGFGFSSAYASVMVATGTWEANPAPVGTFKGSDMDMMVVGNLYDPSTPYTWTQSMSSAFVSSHTLTYQGVGHVLLPHSAPACYQHIGGFLKTGERVRDGYVCQTNKPLDLAPLQASP